MQNSRSKSPHMVQVLVLSRCLSTAERADVLVMSGHPQYLASRSPMGTCSIPGGAVMRIEGFALCRGLLGDSSSSSSDEDEDNSGAAAVSDEVLPLIVDTDMQC